jgi:hypothetical protein
VIDQRESLSQGLTRLKNICNSLEEALSYARGIEGDYQRGLLEAHIRGALREMNAQRAELVSSLSTMQRDGHTARAIRSQQL